MNLSVLNQLVRHFSLGWVFYRAWKSAWERDRVYVSERFNGPVNSVELPNLAQSLLNKKSNQ